MRTEWVVVGLLNRPDPRVAGMLPVVVREGERFRFLGSTPMWGEGCDQGEWEGLVRDLRAVRFERELVLGWEGEAPRRWVGEWVGEELRRRSEGWGLDFPHVWIPGPGDGWGGGQDHARRVYELRRGEWGGKKDVDQIVGRVWFGEAREALEELGGWCERALGLVKESWRAGDKEKAREVAVSMLGVLPNDVRARAAAWWTAKDRARMLKVFGHVGAGVGLGSEEMESHFRAVLGDLAREGRLIMLDEVRRRSERATQDRVVKMFVERLGYRDLSREAQGAQRGPILEGVLEARLRAWGWEEWAVKGALDELRKRTEARGVSLSEANEKAYRALRYGVNVQKGVGAFQETVGLVDWERPERNDFGVAQEVVLAGRGDRRPDVVLYVNGIAVGVLELKRADVSVGEGVRQAITLQEGRESFFSTVQFVFAGNDSEGLRYGTVGTGEKFFVSWKEDGLKGGGGGEAVGAKLDLPLEQMCGKARLLDLMKEFVVFDKGVKKVPRPHQYHGVKAAQERIKKREGGVIWHTQGSGKSILMVLLAKWILQNDPEARVLVVTDREELDTQIAGVMRDAGVIPKDAGDVRVATRAEFVARLEETAPRFFCALVHKFNPADLEGETPKMRGRFYVFVDECHRTQGGSMNRQMKRWMKGAIFLGFTGTPLLRQEKATTEEVFGTYIHTYKFGEAVEDKVVLDLVYEARDVAQRLSSRDEVDKWFSEKTSGLNAHQRALLRKRWARLEEITNTEGRLSRIVEDVVMDFDTQPRLRSSRGTAMLVASSIYDACRYYRSFLGTELGGRCGIVTSFEPNAGKISTEPLGGEERYKFDTYKQHVLREGETSAQYEARVKDDFINRPEKMKLLIVVDKLLTGFDAPSCSTIYLDKQLRDHNLFQAICRTNRLDGDDKPHGCIVDYGRLFANVQHAIAVYNSEELDLEGASEAENNVFMKEALREGRGRLDKAREAWAYQCAPISAPRELEQVFAYFCGAADDARALSEREPLRVQFYKASAAFLRAFAELANELDQAGYSKEEVLRIKRDKELCGQWLMAVKMCAGEHLDLKPFEADMRELLDAYIEADEVRSLGGLGGMTLVEAIVKTGLHDVIARHLNAGGKLSKDGIAEVIIHNLRKAILRGELTDPKYYQELSRILDDLIQKGRDDAASYESFLKGIEELARMLSGGGHSGLPAILEGKPEAQVLFRNLDTLGGAFVCPSDEGERAALALKLHETVKRHAQPPWRGDQRRERKIKQHLLEVLHDKTATEALFEIVVQQVGY